MESAIKKSVDIGGKGEVLAKDFSKMKKAQIKTFVKIVLLLCVGIFLFSSTIWAEELVTQSDTTNRFSRRSHNTDYSGIGQSRVSLREIRSTRLSSTSIAAPTVNTPQVNTDIPANPAHTKGVLNRTAPQVNTPHLRVATVNTARSELRKNSADINRPGINLNTGIRSRGTIGRAMAGIPSRAAAAQPQTSAPVSTAAAAISADNNNVAVNTPGLNRIKIDAEQVRSRLRTAVMPRTVVAGGGHLPVKTRAAELKINNPATVSANVGAIKVANTQSSDNAGYSRAVERGLTRRLNAATSRVATDNAAEANPIRTPALNRPAINAASIQAALQADAVSSGRSVVVPAARSEARNNAAELVDRPSVNLNTGIRSRGTIGRAMAGIPSRAVAAQPQTSAPVSVAAAMNNALDNHNIRPSVTRSPQVNAPRSIATAAVNAAAINNQNNNEITERTPALNRVRTDVEQVRVRLNRLNSMPSTTPTANVPKLNTGVPATTTRAATIGTVRNEASKPVNTVTKQAAPRASTSLPRLTTINAGKEVSSRLPAATQLNLNSRQIGQFPSVNLKATNYTPVTGRTFVVPKTSYPAQLPTKGPDTTVPSRQTQPVSLPVLPTVPNNAPTQTPTGTTGAGSASNNNPTTSNHHANGSDLPFSATLLLGICGQLPTSSRKSISRLISEVSRRQKNGIGYLLSPRAPNISPVDECSLAFVHLTRQEENPTFLSRISVYRIQNNPKLYNSNIGKSSISGLFCPIALSPDKSGILEQNSVIKDGFPGPHYMGGLFYWLRKDGR